jgi:hypothetical protein
MPNNKFWAPKLTISDRKCKEAYVLEERACVRGRRQRAFPIRCITQINNIFVPNWFVRFSHWQWVTRFGHTTHQQFHFSTFDSEVKFQCTRNGLQNLPFVRGHIARILFLPIFAMKLACCFVELASLAAPAPPPMEESPHPPPRMHAKATHAHACICFILWTRSWRSWVPFASGWLRPSPSPPPPSCGTLAPSPRLLAGRPTSKSALPGHLGSLGLRL